MIFYYGQIVLTAASYYLGKIMSLCFIALTPSKSGSNDKKRSCLTKNAITRKHFWGSIKWMEVNFKSWKAILFKEQMILLLPKRHKVFYCCLATPCFFYFVCKTYLNKINRPNFKNICFAGYAINFATAVNMNNPLALFLLWCHNNIILITNWTH